MSTTVTYKGETLTTANNQTRTLETAGKYMEDDVTIVDVTASATLQSKTATYTPTESQQTATITADAGYDGLSDVDVTVEAVSSSYVGSGVTRRDSSDLTVSGATVTAPSGYYSASASASVASGTAGTPTATKGTVSNHSVSVTPSVTNTTGYITGGTKSGTAVTVSASELVSGSQTITENDTYDVTNLASVDVNVSGEEPNLQAKTNIAPTTSSQTITPDAGYDGLSSVQINAMPNGSVTAPSTISGTGSSITTGTNLLTFSKTISVTPTVSTAGYVSSGTAGNSNVSLSASVVTKAAATITPGTTDQTIGSGTYLTGTQTIKGDENLIADNIKKDAVIFNVTGTYEGGSVWQSGIYQDEDGFICVSPNAGASANGITLLAGDIVMSTV